LYRYVTALREAAVVVQACVRSRQRRGGFQRLRAVAALVQSFARRAAAQRRFIALRRAAVVVGL
jgi:hypothetical protein